MALQENEEPAEGDSTVSTGSKGVLGVNIVQIIVNGLLAWLLAQNLESKAQLATISVRVSNIETSVNKLLSHDDDELEHRRRHEWDKNP